MKPIAQLQMTDLLHDADCLSEEAYRSRLRYLGRLVDSPRNSSMARKVRNTGAKRWNRLIQLVHNGYIASDDSLDRHSRSWLEPALGYTALHVFISAGRRRLLFAQIMMDELFSGREPAGFAELIALVAKGVAFGRCSPGIRYELPRNQAGAGIERRKGVRDERPEKSGRQHSASGRHQPEVHRGTCHYSHALLWPPIVLLLSLPRTIRRNRVSIRYWKTAAGPPALVRTVFSVAGIRFFRHVRNAPGFVRR